MKMYFVCEEQGPEWFYCYGVLENGFGFAQHVCSSPNFAPGDLYFTRSHRINALRELFGIEPKTVESETIVVRSKDDIPVWWESLAKLQEGLKPQYERYKDLVGDQKPKIELEFSDGSKVDAAL